MCGIAGIIGSLEGRAAAERMSRALAHRGPDDDGAAVWRDAARGRETIFAHRRLAIIDLSDAGRQPMTSSDGRYSVVFNGEIYNYRELRRELEAEGAQFKTSTDTEALLELYAARGARALDSLRGMFAFAVRDHLTGEVFAARDRLGVKPFYYFEGPDGLLFASEARALLASGLVPRVMDPVSLNSYLSFGAVQEPRTILAGVRSLPPAHYLKVSADGRVREIARYWRLPREKFAGTRAEAVAETRRRLEESVAAHMVSDVPLGAFLSGGLDSTAIVALLAAQKTRPATFTVVFDEHEFSERESARRVADSLGTAHTEIVLAEQNLLARLPQAIASIDQPTIDGVNTWVVADATRGAGVTVALSGLGGDELFGGYPSFRRAAIAGRLAAPFRLLGQGARRRLAGVAATLLGDSLGSQKLAATISAGGELLAAYSSSRGLFARKTRAALLGLRNGRAQLAGDDYHLPPETLSLVAGGGNGADTFNGVSRYEMSLYMANMLLRDTDVMSMAHALEVRVPLLDHHLVEWVYALPGRFKQGGRPKPLLVEALGRDLPPSVLNQRKMGFTLPFERWLHAALKPFVTDALSDKRSLDRVGLDAGAVSQIWHNFERGSRSTSWSRVWGLAVLVKWSRRHEVEIEK